MFSDGCPLFSLDFVFMERRSMDKFRLIEMVHARPILWDSSLPNFKGAEPEKTAAWNEISVEFDMTPQRIERSFKSLRESYRRELATQKQLGEYFHPKWEYFQSMDFLRSVIRERKANASYEQRESLGSSGEPPMTQLDEYAYYIHHRQNQNDTVGSSSGGKKKNGSRRNSSSTAASGDNISTTTTNQEPIKTEGHVKKEKFYDENEEVEELSPIDEDYPFPDIQLVNHEQHQHHHHPKTHNKKRREVLESSNLNLNSNNKINNQPPAAKRKRSSDEMVVTSNDEQQQNQQHSPSSSTFMSERAEFHDRFGNFVAAKLNTLKDNDANELMSKIFMLLFRH